MAAGPGERRLFVGGLGPSVTKDELRAQLGRFGDVSSVELVSRMSEFGNPEKTFAYVNIALSEDALRRCLRALDKSTWRGGQLRVQPARESFLHRLAQERREQQEQREQPPPLGPETPGAPGLHMKAVPGTAVPGHKDWVVSKFGRVLPVLRLRSGGKVLKYDPSRYCHNLKRLGQDGEDGPDAVSVANLTWHLEGGDDAMSKKRQGQFPPTKRAKVGGDGCAPSKATPAHPPTARSRPSTLPAPVNSTRGEPQRRPVGKSESNDDDDFDSEEELRAVLAEEASRRTAAFPCADDTEEDSFEVVGSDFRPFPAGSGVNQKSPHGLDGTTPQSERDRAYDSGDTDDSAAGDPSKDRQKILPRSGIKWKEGREARARATRVSSQMRGRRSSAAENHSSASGAKHVPQHIPQSPSDGSPASGHGESEEELDYDSMMTGCYRLDLTLADLEKLAGAGAESLGGKAPRARQTLSSGWKTKKSPERGARGIHPDDILASLLEGEEEDPPDEQRFKSKFQAFRGVGGLYAGAAPERPIEHGRLAARRNGQTPLEEEASPSSVAKRALDSSARCNGETSPPQDGKEACGSDGGRRSAGRGKHCAVQSPRSGSESENAAASSLSLLGPKKPRRLHAETRGADLGSDGGRSGPGIGEPTQGRRDSVGLAPAAAPEPEHPPEVLKTGPKKAPRRACQRPGMSPEQPQASRAEGPPPAVGPHRHREDNEKRLAALEERRRERELQKGLVRSALCNLDGRPPSRPSHILFSSDSEGEVEQQEGGQKPPPGSHVKQDATGKSSGKLFESSEDEETEPEDDEARFQIKPQFEGKAGRKLMGLQSHFGADDRFRMDARFLESESEEEEEEPTEAEAVEDQELSAEKRRNMQLIRSLLPGSRPAPKPSREETAARQFRNVVRYDPTRLEHATFERKVEPEEKPSKAKRRKQREEAEKLPPVSRDLYFNIAADLKERFRATEPAPGAGAAGPWNEAPEEAAAPGAPGPPAGLGDFTFSFFPPDVAEAKDEPYKVEARPSGRMAWQQDPRFQDSSSEEDEEEPEPAAGSQEVAEPEEGRAPGRPARRFFFFSRDDERLCVGPESFWQGSGSRLSSENWESRTLVLLQDCRKKHKAARRKAKP